MRQVAIRGNLAIGRINIEGRDHLTVCNDGPAPMIYEFEDGSEAEIYFCQPGENLGAHNPTKCMRLRVVGSNTSVIVCNDLPRERETVHDHREEQ